tara:strand:+ start:198 stop:680 length:483 start_codon:yes stop_codon:yes gene_type:complete
MTKEYRKLTDWNPKKGDVFESVSGLQLNTVSEDEASFDFWVMGTEKTFNYFKNTYALTSRATPEEEEAPTGKWIGWNGGESPVHPKTIVEVVGGFDGVWETTAHEARVEWSNVVAYRVIKEYVKPPKPREFWVNHERGQICTYKRAGMMHVREVVGEEDV